MRNLLAYPITKEEKIQTLLLVITKRNAENAAQDPEGLAYGDITDASLAAILKDYKNG